MFVSQINAESLTPNVIDRLLFEGLEDSGACGDCILVLGSIKASAYRVPVAVEAYKAGRSEKILLCGGIVRNFPEGTYREADHMYQTALALGVKKEAIILERSSQNTVENILFAKKELQQLGINGIRSLLLVTTAYHMRRSLAIAKHLFPKHIAILPCPANDRNTRRDNWMQSEVGILRAKEEACKLIRYVKGGTIPDFEI